MRVSVVVSTTNSPCVASYSLAKQDYPFELVCVPSTGNVNRDRNVGARKALGDLLCFCDEKSTVGPNWAERFVLEHERAPSDVLVGQVNLTIENSPPWLTKKFEEFIPKFPNFSISSKRLNEIGGFNEQISVPSLVPDYSVDFVRSKTAPSLTGVDNPTNVLIQESNMGEFLWRSAYSRGFHNMLRLKAKFNADAEYCFRQQLFLEPQALVVDPSSYWFLFSELDPINRLKATIEYSRACNARLQGLMSHLGRN